MQQIVQEQIVRVQAKGLVTIPKRLRDKIGLRENGLARIKKEGGRLILEPVNVINYPIREYSESEEEIKEFIAADERETVGLLKLKGSLKSDIKASHRQIRKAFEEYLANHAVALEK